MICFTAWAILSRTAKALGLEVPPTLARARRPGDRIAAHPRMLFAASAQDRFWQILLQKSKIELLRKSRES
jgi:hypothetical protein